MLIRILMVMALATLVALATNQSSGNVIFFAFGYRTELSWNLFILLELALFILLYILFRVIGIFRRFSLHEFYGNRKNKKAYNTMKKALLLFLSNNLEKARKKMPLDSNDVMEQGLARLLTAQAAHRCENTEARDQILAAPFPKVFSNAEKITRARFAFDEQKYQEALELLKDVKTSNPLQDLVKFEIDIHKALGAWQQVIVAAKKIQDTKLRDEIIEDARLKLIESSRSSSDLDAIWDTFSSHIRHSNLFALRAIRRFIALGDNQKAANITRATLKKSEYNASIVLFLIHFLISQTLSLEEVQILLKKYESENDDAVMIVRCYALTLAQEFKKVEEILNTLDTKKDSEYTREITQARLYFYLASGNNSQAMLCYHQTMV